MELASEDKHSFGQPSADMPAPNLEQVEQMKALLAELQGCRHTIGVSKRCCPVCAYLLTLLNLHFETNFVISDEHSNITSCALPEWLPETIVSLMVVEFGRRLRVELHNLRSSNLHGRRLGTSDTTRCSMDSVRSIESQGQELDYAEHAFADSGSDE